MRNTSADEVGKLLLAVIHGTGRQAAAKKGARAVVSSNDRVVVDTIRNGIIFNGSAAECQKIYALLREIDRPARQVLIEVTVAEVTLTDQKELGVE